MDRFKKVYSQGTISIVEIWVDTETGVNYVFHRDGNAAGFTPLLDREEAGRDSIAAAASHFLSRTEQFHSEWHEGKGEK